MENEEITLEGFKVVKKELFPQHTGPQIAMCDGRIYFNAEAVLALGNPDYIQTLVNVNNTALLFVPVTINADDEAPELKRLYASPLVPDETYKGQKYIESAEFFIAQLVRVFSWPQIGHCTYVLQGEAVSHNQGPALSFDPTEYMVNISYDEATRRKRKGLPWKATNQ